MVALDTDKDGEISAKEIENASKSLKTLDKNGDGKLSPDELRPSFAGRGPEAGGQGRGGPSGTEGRRPSSPEAMVERIMSMDKDGDGKVTKTEAPDQMQRMFERGDSDGDGAISKAEAEEIAQRMAEMRGSGGRGRGQGRGPQGELEGRRERPQRPSEE
jgi:Ca2+-binding EF-hand superfamily protein